MKSLIFMTSIDRNRRNIRDQILNNALNKSQLSRKNYYAY